MPIKVTNKQIKVHTDYVDFCPRWKLETAEYDKAKITSVDNHKSNKTKGDLAEPLTTWPRMPTTEELVYHQFIDSITDSKSNKFNPARDEDRRPIPKTGAMHVITDIIRLKTGDGLEFLLSKGSIIGHDAAGEEVNHHLPRPEMWVKTLFLWRNEYNSNTRGFDKICLGPSGTEIQYLKEFSKENAKELFDQRASDLINFIVKDQVSDEARMVEKNVNALKTFERFANNAFDFLWSGEYIPIQVRQELRQQAAARGDIKGNVSDYEFKGTQSASKAGPGVR
jgi:hypothetical protein